MKSITHPYPLGIPNALRTFLAAGILCLVGGLIEAAAPDMDDRAAPEKPDSKHEAAGRATEHREAWGEYVAGEILVKFTAGVGGRGIDRIRRELGATETKVFPQIRVRHWKLPEGLGIEQALGILSRNPNVVYAEPNYVVEADALPADPYLNQLWGLHNIGQSGGTIDADTDALEAWDIRADAAGIVVGIIDTGIDYTHEDLAANIWSNPGEVIDGLDNDGNGFIDDVRGWDFANQDNDPFDDNGHGTHVAGTIGAVGNNGLGIAGVAWTVQLLPIKFLDGGGRGTTDAAIEAVLYAADLGVPITNNSWGGGRRSKALENAIDASHSLFVAAAGNSGSSQTHYPAGYSLDNILSVAATDAADVLASFSNYSSSWVDLAAPGVAIFSLVPDSGYGVKSGTSMASPHIAGAAALVLAQDPLMTPLQVKERILSTVDPLTSLDGLIVSGGRLNLRSALGGAEGPSQDTTAPAGVVDLAAVSSATTFDSIDLRWTATADDANDPASGTAFWYDLRYHVGTPVTAANWESAYSAKVSQLPQAAGTAENVTIIGLEGGQSYYFALKVVDESGNASAISNNAMESTPANPWFSEVVDAGSSRQGFYQSLALHPVTEYPAIAYSDEANNLVRLAQWDGSQWNLTTVDSGGPGISLAFDPVDGYPSISHGWGKLYFLHFDGSQWTQEVLENRGANNDITSLTYDATGNPFIAYYASSGNGKNATAGLKLASRNGNTWTLEFVDIGAGARYKSLALDAAGNPAIAYSDDPDGDGWLDALKLAYWNGAGWDISTIVSGVVGDGVFASLAFDPATGEPVLVDRNDTVRVHFRVAGVWQTKSLEEGSETNLAIDASGIPYVSYSTYSPRALKVAFPLSGDWSGAWESDTVDLLDVRYRTAIAVDSFGTPAVSYGDGSNYTQKIAVRTSP